MADYVVGQGKRREGNVMGFDLSKVPMLGNAGAKLNHLIDSIMSAEVDQEAAPAPLDKRLASKLPLMGRLEGKAIVDFLMGGKGKNLNRSGDLAPGERPDGTFIGNPTRAELESALTPEQLLLLMNLRGLEDQGKKSPHVLPMWAADP